MGAPGQACGPRRLPHPGRRGWRGPWGGQETMSSYRISRNRCCKAPQFLNVKSQCSRAAQWLLPHASHKREEGPSQIRRAEPRGGGSVCTPVPGSWLAWKEVNKKRGSLPPPHRTSTILLPLSCSAPAWPPFLLPQSLVLSDRPRPHCVCGTHDPSENKGAV